MWQSYRLTIQHTMREAVASLSVAPASVTAEAAAVSRFDYIDALRGIAALLVVWAHVTETFVQVSPSGGWLNAVATQLEIGRIGVVLFFAVSGFVIPSSLRQKASHGVGHAATTFLTHRFFRLFPAYWVSVIATAVFGAFVAAPLSSATVLGNMTMVQTMFGIPDAIGLYWSLRVELVFYALCLALFLGGVLHRPAWLAGAVVASVAAYVGGHLLRRGIPPETWPERLLQFPLYALFLAMMFWGALFRRSQRRDMGSLGAWATSVLVGFPALICMWPVIIAVVGHWRAIHFGESIPHAIGLALFLVLATRFRLHGRLAAWLGLISYSLYLFHPLVFSALLAAVTSGHLPWLAHAHLGVPLLISIFLSVAVAALVYYTVERPAIRLGRRLAG